MAHDYFAKHLSLSEWAIRANLPFRDRLIEEDGTKRARLDVLHQQIGLPIVAACTLSYRDLTDETEGVQSLIAEAGDRPFAVRATSPEPGRPVLRNRKVSVPDLIKWALSRPEDVSSYVFSFEPHIDPELAAILVIGDERVAGEAAVGSILQLNKGAHADASSLVFEFDFREWRFSGTPGALERFLRDAIGLLKVSDDETRQRLSDRLRAEFAGNYLKGYFEVIWSQASGVMFIDYNRVLGGMIDDLPSVGGRKLTQENAITGLVGCRGLARGIARVVVDELPQDVNLGHDEVLVCRFTDPDFLPLINAAAAVVTDVGGILSHAAIVCRELHKPCVIGTSVATQRIKTGDYLEVDATLGVVRINPTS